MALFKGVAPYNDKDSGALIRAGLNDLEKYSQVAEMLTLMKEFNCNDKEVWQLDDQLCTFVLLYKKENVNFEKRFAEIKRKEITRK